VGTVSVAVVVFCVYVTKLTIFLSPDSSDLRCVHSSLHDYLLCNLLDDDKAGEGKVRVRKSLGQDRSSSSTDRGKKQVEKIGYLIVGD
jgi:hypothetical protein